MNGGYLGQILWVDLASGRARTAPLDPQLAADYIGGRGLGTRLLYDRLAPGTAPLSPENPLVFATGPLNGTAAALSGRYEVVTRSPLTGTVLGANSGGRFALDLKQTGYDAVVIEGAAAAPCYLWIHDEGVEIRDASHLWGLDTRQTTERLLAETHERAGVACIGPAGERGVLFASIINDRGRAAGRGGAGAVMGAKHLKAVVVHGHHQTPIADPQRFKAAREEARTALSEAPVTKNALREFGTAVLVHLINEYGGLPVHNFQRGYFPDADSISGQTLKETIYERSVACANCFVACGRATRTARRSGEGPEYESLWAFGPMCGVRDLEAITEANYTGNELGFDTISAGSTIACAMELWEREAFDSATRAQVEAELGTELAFGNARAMLRCSELIGRREGIGVWLAEGSARLAARFGHPELAMSVKGMELPAYDPRAFRAMALALATSNRGGCHLRAYMIAPEAMSTPTSVDRFATSGKATLVKLYQDLSAVVDSMGMCIFTTFALNPAHYAALLAATTGIERSAEQVLEAGERIWLLERLFNAREGFTRRDDTLPQRLLQESLPGGHSKAQPVEELAAMLDAYYQARGWDRQGHPQADTLARLGLAE
ncbi:MAG: aldehyde ferredoxin oxidoreductase family protein [Anaerolineae bacterium]|nr:aldehyde ferredoxin oxidoreductase family protein [Anaerolineae bacterium]